jgi:hypothetical protein
MTEEGRIAFGLAALFAAAVDVAVGTWLLLGAHRSVMEGDDGKPPPQMTECERCGRRVILEALEYHKRRCTQTIIEQRVARYDAQSERIGPTAPGKRAR